MAFSGYKIKDPDAATSGPFREGLDRRCLIPSVDITSSVLNPSNAPVGSSREIAFSKERSIPMSVKLITYDLNSPGQNHQKVLNKIKSYPNWAKLSESSYAVETSASPEAIYNAFSPLLDSNDSFFVITLSKPWWGLGSSEVLNWLTSKL